MTQRTVEPDDAQEVCADFLTKTNIQVEGRCNRLLFRLGRFLMRTALKDDWYEKLGRLLKSCTGLVTWTYLSGLLVLLMSMRWVGEANITSAFLLYLPPLIWFLPAIPVMALTLCFHRRAFLISLVFLAVLLYFCLGYRFGEAELSPDAVATVDGLSILTYNRGHHMNQSLQPFKNATRPDLLVFQDTPNRADVFLRTPDYAEFGYGASVGEFTLLSRYPIVDKVLLPQQAAMRAMRFARFVVDWNGQSVSIYAVHMMTPREVLNSYSRGAFLWGLLGVPGTPWAAKRAQYQVFWDQQIEDVALVLAAVKDDPNPCVLAGDFNATSLGHIHQMITDEMVDTHLSAGSGFGFSFPGVTRNPLSFGGPWLRIDYIFHDARWETVQCITEEERPSQHRAVMARLRFLGDSRQRD